MSIINGLEWTFDTVASVYEKMRPGYVAELYQRIFDYVPISASSRAVEIGIGGGQATLPILQTGCAVTAVEYGEHFSQRCREKFKDFQNFSVITGKFEDVDFAPSTYDLIFSATAFHWVPEEIGYPKVFSMLKSGGAFAQFANHPYSDKGNPPLAKEINRLYAAHFYKFYNRPEETFVEYSEEDARRRAMRSEQYGFMDSCYALYHRTRTFSAKEYVALMGTYSDHIAMEEGIRTEFFSKVEEAIRNHGGTITIYDTIDLQLARKP
ncbi:MAG: class I SAM-dependent methyltransferase [Oscillospiraceae bacterium]|nr:class I SAM-dependent methyltransferase [Oscillospiraceae bacterium]